MRIYAMKVMVFGGFLAAWLCYSALHVGAQITDPDEVKALRAIRKSLKDPIGYLRNWKKGDPCTSNWTGLQCFSTTENDGYLHIRELQLMNMNLSGRLSPELGQLSYMEYLGVMCNEITGTIPKEIGKITSLKLLLLNSNQLTGPLPEELGSLSNLVRLQIDENHISGPLPKSFSNLNQTLHFHMNNNSLSGQIPPELSILPSLMHLLLDNNNFSGYLPPEFSQLPNLLIIQLDNNHFEGTIPASYGNMSKLVKMSLRNCSLQGPVPDLSRILKLAYLDLSLNQLNGSIPSNKLSDDITTIDLSYNQLSGSIPSNFSGLPLLQRLSLENNSLSGDVPSNIWRNRTFNGTESLLLDFQNNMLSNISGIQDTPTNVSMRLQGNPICAVVNQIKIVQFCTSQTGGEDVPGNSSNSPQSCLSQTCPEHYDNVKVAPDACLCAAPVMVGYRLKSPGFSNFLPYEGPFGVYLTSGLAIDLYQLSIESFIWNPGPRLMMYLKFFPNNQSTFNGSEIQRIRTKFLEWAIPRDDDFGPYELLNFTLLGPYQNVLLDYPKSGISKGALAGSILGGIAGAVTFSVIISILIMRRHMNEQLAVSRRQRFSRTSVKVDGAKGFTFQEMTLATNNFNNSTLLGKGGYGKVYKGILADGTTVAIKRAYEGSVQGEREFFTEIELLSRVHHRNLVSLVGYCDEEGEQMLVYEFMSNGTLRDCLSVKSKEPLNFSRRLRIALGSAKGVLYLHTEANPPIFHRDIKANNILLDSRFTAKVADFGLSKLAPVPDVEGMVPGHVSTVVKGTPGYLDPEYVLTHNLTDKSDVYSLGVVFLELLTGMQPISCGKNIVREVNMAYESGKIFSVIDEGLGSYLLEYVEKFVTLALKCCQDYPDDRPTMTELVREIENILLVMPESDAGTSESFVNDPKSIETPAESFKSLFTNTDPYLSSYTSGR